VKKELIVQLHTRFEAAVLTNLQTGAEFWLARDLQGLLGYTQWRSFEAVIARAITACHNSGHDPGDHFARTRKLVEVGSAAKREIDDIALTRYACYLIAQNAEG
jgi:DNA-damage-inducible protein D